MEAEYWSHPGTEVWVEESSRVCESAREDRWIGVFIVGGDDICIGRVEGRWTGEWLGDALKCHEILVSACACEQISVCLTDFRISRVYDLVLACCHVYPPQLWLKGQTGPRVGKVLQIFQPSFSSGPHLTVLSHPKLFSHRYVLVYLQQNKFCLSLYI